MVVMCGQVSGDQILHHFHVNHAEILAWGGFLSVDEFIRVSKEGRQRGDFIMHRENSTLVELNASKLHAIGK